MSLDSHGTSHRGPFVGAIISSFTMGTVHAFSVMLEGFEHDLGIGRGAASSIYSTALVSLTFAVFTLGVMRNRRTGSWWLPGATGAIAAAGLILSAMVSSLPAAVIGYGVLFGGANGVAYAVALENAAASRPTRPGHAMGLVTAAYALGAAVAAGVIGSVVSDETGRTPALVGLAITIAAANLYASWLLRGWIAVSALPSPSGPSTPLRVSRSFVTYGLAVLTGLMTLGHAAEIVDQIDETLDGAAATIALAAANAIGGLVAARVADRRSVHRVFRVLLGINIAALLLLATVLGESGSLAIMVALIGLCGVGFAYGAVIAVFPPMVRSRFGPANYAAAYGRIFLAWGLAGLAGPTMAGIVYDHTGSYLIPVLVAAGLGLMAMGTFGHQVTGDADGHGCREAPAKRR